MLSSNPLDSYSIAKSLIVAAIVNRNFDRPPRLTELRPGRLPPGGKVFAHSGGHVFLNTPPECSSTT